AEHTHAHGVDPHLWTSPRALQRMAANAYEAIHAAYPDSAKYTRNYDRLQRRLQELDARTAEKIERSGVEYFIIYHPALTYYARDYGLEQAAIETDGKEPSARHLGETIRRAREKGVRKILYQSQFPASVVETVARDIGAQAIRIDPMREDAIANIDEITDLIASE
ncbi:MAG: zinc ABC transporter substrate-binding protein, partial [Alistipes sp.]|nr:zinc ABC transporter substrate-binding protein [Alistipes sp.]